MKKEYLSKRTKFTSNTYMKEAIDYDIVIIKENDLFITIKKYKSMSDKFSLTYEDGKVIDYIDKNYYVVELTPLKENYNIRYYFNSNKEYIDYYIDISLKNGVLYKMPYYIDLYLDIVNSPYNNIPMFWDEDELLDALLNRIITKKEYNMAYQVGNKLLKEIKNNCNKYFKINVLDYINKYFK